MKEKQTVHFIGCAVLGPDITHIAAKLKLKLKRTLLPGGLHSQPHELRRRLQQALDEAGQDPSLQRIVVGYGLCGKGTVDIKAPGVPLIIPKVHDCIALFLGSDRAYQKEFAKYPGTFYISSGWYLEKERPKIGQGDQVRVGTQSMGSREITEKYGEKQGKEIIDFFSTWRTNYQRAAFIDTGVGKTSTSEKYARALADKFQWHYQKIQGDLSLLTRMLTTQESDEQILVVPPGYVTVYSPLENGLVAAAPTAVPQSQNAPPRALVFDQESAPDTTLHYGLGIDAGGTYTDAAIYDFHQQTLIDKNKALTTKWDFTIGIDQVLSGLKNQLLTQIDLISVSSTLATNAIVEGEGQKAGLIVMSAYPDRSNDLIRHRPKVHVKGQMTISGQEIQPIDPKEIRSVARQLIVQQQVSAFAVSGYAGAVNPAHELEIKSILLKETGLTVTCGHELSDQLNFLVRAQTAVLNARIIPRMIKFFQELDAVLSKREIRAPVMVVKGDGTLISADLARQRPVETILSGPAASVAGARLLTGLSDALVVDIGGTTTDTAELSEGVVEVCASGARVGGFETHVQALNMRTIGLGGDSLICWQNDEICLGPRRVAPVVWADAQSPEGVTRACSFMESLLKHRPGFSFSPIILVGMPGAFPFEPSAEEIKLYALLQQRPQALEELVELMQVYASGLLFTQRLEECGLVQRCGLTPTDLLHLNGACQLWKPEAARRMLAIIAGLSGMQAQKMMEIALETFEKKLAKELLKKQLATDYTGNLEDEQGLAGHLLERILSGKYGKYSLRAELKDPIIGIGAPAHSFLPQAGKRLQAEVVIPENADVANALGAISSHVLIRQKVTIRPDHQGRFIVENIEGGHRFDRIDKAEAWAVEHLKKNVQAMGRIAGTSRKTVHMEFQDRMVDAADGTALFLDRSIQATLSGSPDLRLIQH